MADAPFTVTVSQINKRLANLVKGDTALRDVYVKGELSNFVNHYKTGHFYFTLKDDECGIKAVMFRNYAENVPFEPESGMSVIIRGSINVFERDGANQLYAVEMLPDGVGALYLAYEQTKAKLAEDGYFEQKRDLPQLPKKICLITAENGAALQDMLNIISRRYPVVKLILIPTLVQGVDAPKSIVKAFSLAQKTDADLIIFGRGGGSIEDLCAFNDVNVAMAIYNSKIPTISAVGHETDFTIGDFVADLRAPTPSAAAELAVPDISVIEGGMDGLLESLYVNLTQRIASSEERIVSLSNHIKALTPEKKLSAMEENLVRLEKQIFLSINDNIERKERLLYHYVDVISALSPLNVLSRGYAMVSKDDVIVSDTAVLAVNDKVNIRLNKGSFTAKILSISENSEVLK